MRKISFLFLLISFSSCSSLFMKWHGISEPKVENNNSIKAYLKKIGQDTLDVYAMDSTVFQELRMTEFKPGWKPTYRPIQIRVYDKTGAPIAQWASCEGYIHKVPLFNYVPPKNLGTLDTTMNLTQELNRYSDLYGRKTVINPVMEYDYHFVVHFAKWFSGMNKESFNEIREYCKKHPELRIKVYKINSDMQESWGGNVVFELL